MNLIKDAIASGEKGKKNYYLLEVVKRSVKSWSAKLGAILLVLIIVVCLLAPLFTPYGPNDLDAANRLQGPSAEHFLGTDEVGRDLWCRLLYGGRYSLAMGFAASIFSLFVEIVLGCMAGYFGGKTETIIMRIMDVWSVLPGTLLAIMISAALGPGFVNTLLAISIGRVPGGVRLIRGQILGETGREYIEAAESINCSKISIMFKHLLPNVVSPMIVSFTMGVGSNITAAAGLSFIGLGVQPPTPEWGAMLSGARGYMMNYPYLITVPGIAIALIILATNLLGDGLRDALDPKLRR